MSALGLALIAGFFVVVALWQRSNFLQIIAGIVTIGFGIYWIDYSVGFLNIIEGTAIIAVGLYLLITVGADMLKGN